MIKSASSELEALIGGAAAEADFFGPEVAYATPPKSVASHPMASYLRSRQSRIAIKVVPRITVRGAHT